MQIKEMGLCHAECGVWYFKAGRSEDYILAAHLYRYYVNLCARPAAPNTFNTLFLLVARPINLTMNLSRSLFVNDIEILFNIQQIEKICNIKNIQVSL